jgi:glycine betaine catabolism A
VTTLERCEPGLPARWYHDDAHHRRELDAVWYRTWSCAGRVDEIPNAGDYRLHRIGDQCVVVVRGNDGALRAFHNTCRHRGAELCEADRGAFRHGRIVCPYHAWTYDLAGNLVATPHRLPSADYDPARHGLYSVPLATWGGYVFVNLAPGPSFEQTFGERVAILDHWPLADLVLAQRDAHTLACNWKVFWENFSECYHCPRLHPELCSLVPMYGRGVVSAEDDPRPTAAGAATTAGSPLAPGAVTWTPDGHTDLPGFASLTPEEQAAGMTFVTLLPTMFVVTHVDYVRAVRVRPLGPESTELTVDWLVAPDVAHDGFDRERLCALGRLVVAQDARVCELNQRGLRSRAHERGVLVAQEHGVYELHRWIRDRLGEAP